MLQRLTDGCKLAPNDADVPLQRHCAGVGAVKGLSAHLCWKQNLRKTQERQQVVVVVVGGGAGGGGIRDKSDQMGGDHRKSSKP